MTESKSYKKRRLESEQTKVETKEEKKETKEEKKEIIKKPRGIIKPRVLPGREELVQRLVNLNYPAEIAEIIAESINRCEYFECGLGEPGPFNFGSQSCIAPCQHELCPPWWENLIRNPPKIVEFDFKDGSLQRQILNILIQLSVPRQFSILLSYSWNRYHNSHSWKLGQYGAWNPEATWKDIDTQIIPSLICQALEDYKDQEIKVSMTINIGKGLEQIPMTIRFPEFKNGYYFARTWSVSPKAKAITSSINFPPESSVLYGPHFPPESENVEE